MLVDVLMALVVVLAALNLWFISRLVKKIEKVDRIDSIEITVNSIQQKVAELSDLSRRIGDMEKQMAVFDYILKGRG